MEPSSEAKGPQEPDLTIQNGPLPGSNAGSWDSQSLAARLFSFRFTYVAIALLIILYTFTIRSLETYLQEYFTELTERAIRITDLEMSIAQRPRASSIGTSVLA